MSQNLAGRIALAAQMMAEAESFLFITGAGLSADSGLPTYRGAGGLYDGTTTEDGVRIEAALSGEMLRRRPELTWKYLRQIGRAVAAHSFNPAHAWLASLEQEGRRVCILTQNIDGYHLAAGSRNVIEIHGSMWRIRCDGCGRKLSVEIGQINDSVPPCADCLLPMRPDVVLFGEMLPVAELDRLDQEMARGFGLVASIGTSSQFPYIQAPMLAAVREGIPTMEINPAGETPLSPFVDLHLPLGAVAAMEAIRDATRSG